MLKKMFLFVAAFMLLATSCTQRLTDFTVISTKNVPIGDRPTDLVKANMRVQGVDKAHIIIVPFKRPDLKEAIDKAIEKYPGAVALADGVVKHKSWSVFFYGQSSFIVEGTPLYETGAAQPNNTGYQSSNNAYTQPSNTGNTTNVMRITHQVNNEQNVTELAKMYGVSVADILKWNKLTNPALTPGQNIIIYLPN